MKPLILCFFLVFSLSVGILGDAQAQNPKIRALKVEVVTGKMQLNAEQRSRFLPLYNQYSDELMKIYHARRQCVEKPNKLEGINERQKLDQKIVDLKARYKNDFLKIITPEQLSAMYKGEEEFKEMLIERLKN